MKLEEFLALIPPCADISWREVRPPGTRHRLWSEADVSEIDLILTPPVRYIKDHVVVREEHGFIAIQFHKCLVNRSRDGDTTTIGHLVTKGKGSVDIKGDKVGIRGIDINELELRGFICGLGWLPRRVMGWDDDPLDMGRAQT